MGAEIICVWACITITMAIFVTSKEMKTRKMNTGKYIEINEMVETIKITKNHMKDEEKGDVCHSQSCRACALGKN